MSDGIVTRVTEREENRTRAGAATVACCSVGMIPRAGEPGYTCSRWCRHEPMFPWVLRLSVDARAASVKGSAPRAAENSGRLTNARVSVGW
jgi:hypothetical protein